MHVLVVSPIPSHPVDQGNSARITSIASQLQALGHVVHFFYYPLEGLHEAQRREMESAWDYFHTLPADVDTGRRSLGEFFGVDDWYDPRVGDAVRQLHRQWGFGMVLANYVWFSAVLDELPANVLKVIDTHDVFGDRHLRFTELGMRPEWFYTTIDEERRGLARADVVIAIQDQEAEQLRQRLAGLPTRVETIGYLAPPRFLDRHGGDGKLTLGYLGSGNPFNVASVTDFAKRLNGAPEVAAKYRFLLAGSICKTVKALPPFEVVGLVDSTEEFYGQVDGAINPMIGGTGLKIKTLEALSFGKMVAGSADAFAGVQLVRESQDATSRQLARDLERIGLSFAVLSAHDSRATFLAYLREHLQQFERTFEASHGQER
jgi:hypothetical protein